MNDGPPSSSRRKLLKAAAATAAVTLVSGCRAWFTTPLPSCITAPPLETGVASQTAPGSTPVLTLDIHTHIFNGTDLQVKEFIQLNHDIGLDPVLQQLAGALVQDLSWSLAPSGREELQELLVLANCSGSASMSKRIDAHRERAYQHARTALRKTKVLRDFMQSQTTPSKASTNQPQAAVPSEEEKNQQHLARLSQLLQATSRAEYKKAKTVKTGGSVTPEIAQPPTAGANAPCAQSNSSSTPSIDGLLDFIIQGFQYRFVSYCDYLDTYNPSATQGLASLTTAPPAITAHPGCGALQSPPRTIDFAIANLVDYDWPLAMGSRTRTSLRDQLLVMEQISLLSHGRIHGFVPYDPMRQVAIRANKRPAKHCPFSGGGSNLSFEELADAVMARGFLGIKLYPPMGFLPLGNTDLDPSIWGQKWLPGWMAQPVAYPSDSTVESFGARLDEELNRLYSWAVRNQVPITAHAENSNGPSTLFESFALSTGWRKVLSAHPGLRINFGHTGGISSALSNNPITNGIPADAQGFIDIFQDGANAPGQFAYGDLSFADGVLTNESALADRLRSLFGNPTSTGIGNQAPNAANRLMYGSDWFFLIQESNYNQYLSNFTALLESIDQSDSQAPSVSQRVFGLNGADWLGLFPGQSSRMRLEAFYRNNGIDLANDPPEWFTKVDTLNQVLNRAGRP